MGANFLFYSLLNGLAFLMCGDFNECFSIKNDLNNINPDLAWCEA